MKFLSGFLISVTFFTTCFSAGSEISKTRAPDTEIRIDNSAGGINLQEGLKILPDNKGQYAVEQIVSGKLDTLFSYQPFTESRERDQYAWIKINVHSAVSQKTDWLLRTSKYYPEISCYTVNQHGVSSPQFSGWSVPTGDRTVQNPNILFSISLQPGESLSIYLRIHADRRWVSWSEINAELLPAGAFYQQERNNTIIQGLYAGICIISVLFWLMNFFYTRKINYLLLSFATLSTCLYILAARDILTIYFWDHLPFHNLSRFESIYLWLPLTIISNMMLAANLDVKSTYPGVIKYYYSLAVVTILAAPICSLFLEWEKTNFISSFFMFTCFLVTSVLLILNLIKKSTGALFALVTYSPFLIAHVINALFGNELRPITGKLFDFVQAGSAATTLTVWFGMVTYLSILRSKRALEQREREQMEKEKNLILQKQMEQLIQSEKKFGDIVNYSSDFISIVNLEGILEFVNPRITKMLGYLPEDVLQHSAFDFIHPEDSQKFYDAMQGGYTNPGITQLVEGRLRTKDNNYVFVECRGGILYNQNEMTGAILIVRDVTERKLAEQRELDYKKKLEQKVEERTFELKEAIEHLKASQEQLIQQEKLASLGQMTAGIAHEIKNPLNFVNNFSELSLELIGELDQATDESERKELLTELKNNMDKISVHGKRADSIISGMLMHSRNITEGKKPADINLLCEDAMNLAFHGMKARIAGFDCNMERDFMEGIPMINIISQDISRVILNLLMNAFYATTSNKNGRIPLVRIATASDKEAVLIKVKDNGTGIPSGTIQKIFEPFFTTKPAGQGTGLGLSISYDIIKSHGGYLGVESKENEFTEFTIKLPF